MRLRFLRCCLLYPAASACVCISNGVAEEMRGLNLLPPDHIRVIYNPVVTGELLEEARAPVPHPWLAPGEPPVVLGAGRLGDQKDFATLVRAFALLARDLPDVRLIVLGEGKQRRMLERLIEEKNLTGRTLLPGYAPNWSRGCSPAHAGSALSSSPCTATRTPPSPCGAKDRKSHV